MRKTVLAAAAALTLALSLSACSTPAAESSPEPEMSQSSAMGMEKSGDFMGLNDKTVQGSVTVSDGELTLTGFSSDEGPDLHVYLTTGTDEAAVSAGNRVDAVSFDTASQTFALTDIDVADFTYVVIHCDKAKAVFGAAKLS
ncbi:DM13 domain-containing protein [Streptomyces sp. AC495_CC817]|uniref:DM13 domain-containing protein n=1 Tax=Streptomyces sp. AC495_CC817 TaxID=2823900 RepID=UPI001C2785EF|nr:DM13 domain-containing protein [Streptomyces sp. AC495_CC817]